MSELKGKVAVVTGASKGIGAGIAKELAAAGAAVVVNYVSSKAGAERVVAEIAETGGTAIAVQGDVSKASDVRRLFAETRKAFGRLDVLVNNAGVFHFQPLEEVTEAEYRWHFDTNVLGPLLASQAEKQMVARTALGRPGRPDDIARTVAFLASDQSGWLTGERIEASGGYA